MVTLKNYKECLKNLTQILGKDVDSIYEYGSFRNPGLSDIDLIVVINNPNKNLKTKLVEIKKKYDFFFGYSNIMVASKSLIKHIHYLDKLNLKKVSGSNVLFKFPNKKEKINLKLLEIIDWAPERIVRLMEVKKNFLSRKYFGLINSSKYSLININHFQKKNKYTLLIEEIDIIRRNHQIITSKQMKRVFDKLIKYILEGLNDISKTSFFKDLETNSPKYSSLAFPNKSKIFFGYEKSKIIKNKNFLFLPKSFGYVYYFYNQCYPKSHLSKIINRFYKKDFDEAKTTSKNNELKKILTLRCKSLSENISLLKKLKIKDGLYKFGWYM